MTTIRVRSFSWTLAAALVAAVAPAARADVEVTLSRAQGAISAVARTSSEGGNGVIVVRGLPRDDAVTSYDETLRTEAEFEGIRSTGYATHRTTVETSGDTLKLTSSAIGSGTTTLTGSPTSDLASGGSGGAEFDLGFRVSRRSSFTVTGVLDTTFAKAGPFDGFSSSGGAQITYPGGGLLYVGFPRSFTDIRAAHLSFTESGILEAGTTNVVSLWMSGVSGNGTGGPVGRSQWHITLTVVPAPLFTDEFRWINVSGGSFSSAANWNPQAVPVENETQHATAIFPLFTGYSVDVGIQRTDRIVVRNGVVTFLNAAYSADSTTLAEPSLVVTDFGTLQLKSGLLQTVNTAIGPDADSTGEVVVGEDATWLNSSRLAVGAGGDGILILKPTAIVRSAESLVGAGGAGSVDVAEDAKWTSGNLSVGFSSDGALNIAGGLVESDEAFVGFGPPGPGGISEVVVDGASSWLAKSVTIGRQGTGIVEVSHGGFVIIDSSVSLGTSPGVLGTLTVTGARGARDARVHSSLGVDGAATSTLLVGNGGTGEVRVLDGAFLDVGLFVSGSASIGLDGGTGFVDVTGIDALDPEQRSTFYVGGPLAVGTADVMGTRGTLSIGALGEVSCASATVGGGSFGAGTVELRGDPLHVETTSWSVTTDLVAGARGEVAINDALVVVGGDVSIFERGVVAGVNGTLRVAETVFVFDGGTLAAPLRAGNQVVSVAKKPGPVPRPAVFTIDGDLDVAGTVVVEVAGRAARTQFAEIVVTGDAKLGGTLVLQFMNGYAPRTGDRFGALRVAGTTTGSFAGVEARGLAPGAEFETTSEGGELTVTAMNDAVALPTVSVKANVKRLSERKRKAGVFTISRKGRTVSPLVVRLAIGGRAENGIDYLLLRPEVTIPAGKRSVRVKLTPVRDGDVESPETVEVRVVPGSEYTQSLKSLATLKIADR